MADRVLYSFRRCPYAMRARMALFVSGQRYEHREVVLRDKPPEMLEASPKGTVPVMVLEDDRVLEESLQIMRWALSLNDPEGWLERGDADLLEAIDGPFKHHLDRYKYSARYEDADPQMHRAECMKLLDRLEQRLTQSGYLAGDARGFIDIATFPFVRQFANSDRAWFNAQPLPHLHKWLESLIGSQLFADIMSKHPQWKAA